MIVESRSVRWAREIQIALLVVGVAYVVFAMHGLPWTNGLPDLDGGLHDNSVGGDFINMWSAAKLTIMGRVSEIYVPDSFMMFERGTIPHDVGVRLWAYPPTSLLLIPPLAWLGFLNSFVVWSLIGLGVLAAGARRLGFDWLETVVIVTSPAAAACVYYGQTGNVAAGLLMIALSSRRSGEKLPIVAAALLSLKPQIALLLPVVWLVRRYWRSLLWSIVLVLGMAALSLLLFGFDAWRSYASVTLPLLDELERRGTGAFMDMIPTVFIGLRVLNIPASPASLVHLLFAASVAAFCCWRILRSRDRETQVAIALAGASLITPYIHIYDLAPLVAAGMLVLRRWQSASLPLRLLAIFVVMTNSALPALTVAFNLSGVPLSPLVILALLAMVSFEPARPPAKQAVPL